jgi:hypothetical protein
VTTETVDLDVDTTTDANDEAEEVAAQTETPAEKPAAKAAKEKARGDLPEGKITPVGLAKVINERQLHRNRDGAVVELLPQMVYSYIKNAPKDDPYPGETVTDSLSKSRDNVANIEDAVAWWIRKTERAAARKANASAKAEKKAATPEASAPADGSPTVVEDTAAAEEAE